MKKETDNKQSLQQLPPIPDNPSREEMFYEYIRDSEKVSFALILYLIDHIAIQNEENPDPVFPFECRTDLEKYLSKRQEIGASSFPSPFPVSLIRLGIKPFPAADPDLLLILHLGHERQFGQLSELETIVWTSYFSLPPHHIIKAKRLNPEDAQRASYDTGDAPKGWRPMCFCINPNSTKDEILADLSEEIEWCVGDEIVPIDDESRNLLPRGLRGRGTCFGHHTWLQKWLLFGQWTRGEGAGTTLVSAKERQAFQEWKRKHFVNVVKEGRRGPKTDADELPSPKAALTALRFWRILKTADNRSLRTVFELPDKLHGILPYSIKDSAQGNDRDYPDTGQIQRKARQAERIFKILEAF